MIKLSLQDIGIQPVSGRIKLAGILSPLGQEVGRFGAGELEAERGKAEVYTPIV